MARGPDAQSGPPARATPWITSNHKDMTMPTSSLTTLGQSALRAFNADLRIAGEAALRASETAAQGGNYRAYDKARRLAIDALGVEVVEEYEEHKYLRPPCESCGATHTESELDENCVCVSCGEHYDIAAGKAYDAMVAEQDAFLAQTARP